MWMGAVWMSIQAADKNHHRNPHDFTTIYNWKQAKTILNKYVGGF